MNFTAFGKFRMPTKRPRFYQFRCAVLPKDLQVMVIFEAAVVLAELDRRDLEAAAASVAVLGPSPAAELLKQLLRRSDRAAADQGLRLVAMVVRALGPTALADVTAAARGMAALAMAAFVARAVEVSGMRVNALGELVIIQSHGNAPLCLIGGRARLMGAPTLAVLKNQT